MNTLEETIDAVDFLITASEMDPDACRTLTTCRNSLAALSWERFRIRHETASMLRCQTKRRAAFVLRHKGAHNER